MIYFYSATKQGEAGLIWDASSAAVAQTGFMAVKQSRLRHGNGQSCRKIAFFGAAEEW
jgi:hypothetical protein